MREMIFISSTSSSCECRFDARALTSWRAAQ